MYVYKVVKGEKAAIDLLTRMKALQDGKFHWCESFARAGNGSTGEITVERTYEKAPTDEYYSEYIIMYMRVDNPKPGQRAHGMISMLRDWAHEDIRAGKIKVDKL